MQPFTRKPNYILTSLFAFFCSFLGLGYSKAVFAYDVGCVSAGIADYMRTVIDNLGIDNLGSEGSNIKLLTPTFNMSEPQFEDLYRAFINDPNTVAVRSKLAGTIGNAYNVSGQTIGYWVKRINNAGGPIGEMHLAETGRFPPNPVPASLISSVASESGITLKSANLFNAFNNNGMFSHHQLSDEEIQSVCAGNCSNIGVNFAGGFDSGSYARARRLGLGYVLGIVSRMGDVDAVVGAANAGFIPIVRIGWGNCDSSEAGEFEDALKYAAFIKAVSLAVGGRTVYFIVGPNEPDVEQWWASNYGSGIRCGCSAHSDSDYFEGDEEGPLCSPGSSKLKIKGTLKSSRLFTYDPMDPDKLNRVPEQNSKNPSPRDYPIITNQKVAGAVVAVYKSQKTPDPSGPLPPGVKMVNFTGKKDGKIVGKLSEDRTGAEGMFEIETSVTCEEIWDGAKDGWKQYLAIMCSDNPDGRGVRMMLKDLYSIHLRPGVRDAVLDLRDINIDCDATPPMASVLGVSTTGGNGEVLAGSTSGLFSAPNDLNYVIRNKDTFLACSGTPKLTEQMPATNYAHRSGDHRLLFRDEYTPESSHSESIVDRVKAWFREKLLSLFYTKLLGGEYPFNGRTEGRLSLQRVMCDMRKIYGTTPGFFRGVKEGYLHVPSYYLKGAPPGVDTYNNYEEKPEPFNCEMLRRSSLSIGEEGYEDFNTQTSGGFFNNLSPPFGGLVRKADGSIDPYLSGDVARYLAANKSTDPKTGLVVCKDDFGVERYLGEFMPPEGYCGDLDNSRSVDNTRALNGGEMPCPERFSCGDYNGNGIRADEGEVDCASVRVQNDDLSGYGRPGYYKFDVRYFPQFALDIKYTRTLGKEDNYRIFENNDDKSEFESGRGIFVGGWFDKREGAGGVSRPDNAPSPHTGKETSRAFLGQLSVRRPSTINGVSFFTTLHTLSADKDAMYPHHMIMSSPQWVDSSDSAEIVKKSVRQAAKVVKTEDIGGVSRIGLLDNLCTCSHVEDGTNPSDAELGNCFHDAQAIGDIAPDPKEPLNDFDSTRDAKLDNEGGDYGVFGSWRHPENRASKVAADYDWRHIETTTLVERGSKTNAEKGTVDTHYEQPVVAGVIEEVLKAVARLGEIIQCATNVNVWGENNTMGSINCSRKVSMVGKASTWTPFKVRSDYMRNWYVVGEVLTAPFTTLPDIDSVCEEDTSYTKAYMYNDSLGDSPDGKGKESYEGESFENSLAYLVNSVKPPTFEGEYTACRRVAGWQEEKIVDNGLFAAVCGSSGECWVGGATKNETWARNSKEYISFSSRVGASWSANQLGNNPWFIHGLDYYNGRVFAAGEQGRAFNLIGSSWVQASEMRLIKPRPGTNSLIYTGYLYDIGGGPGGYIATGTGHVFYSPDGRNNWAIISKTDSQTGLIGCESTDWPYGCIEYDSENPGACDAILNNATPDCCCVGYSSDPAVDDDGIPQTPSCPNGARGTPGECWLWGSSSIWGVDCDPVSGDCVVAGQRSPKAWYGNASGAGGLGNADNWRRYQLPVSGTHHAMDVAFAGSSSLIYLVGGASSGGDAGGGFILMSQNKGARWDNVTPLGIDSGFKGIDCFDADNCAVVGSKGQVVVLRDGQWRSWESLWPGDPVIEEAKRSSVRFWDVAYPSRDKIVAVGFKPKSPGSADVDGVIYTLGQREICDEAPVISCPSPSGASSCPFNDGGTLVWNNNNTTSCLPAQTIKDPSQIPGATDLVPVYGTIEFRDPVTYGNQNYILNSCNLAPPARTCNPFINGVPMITVDYRGGRYEFKLDKSLYDSCPRISDLVNIGEINYRILVPSGSRVALRVGDQACGEVNPCVSDTIVKGVDRVIEDWFNVNLGLCANAIVWSQVRPHAENGVPVDYTNQCGYTERCKQDYCDNVGLQYSGNCVAQRKGYPVGFKPCQ